MRMLLINAVILLSVALLTQANGVAQAQELNLSLGGTSREQAIREAEKFFDECLRRPIINLSDTTDQAFCACSASSLQNWLEKPMTRTQNREFFQSPNKELTQQVLVTEIYGPCLHIPVYEMAYLDCVSDEDHGWSARTDDGLTFVCACIAQGDEAFFRDYGQPYLEMRYATGFDVRDPIDEIKRSTDYYRARSHQKTQCYQELRRAQKD